MVISFRPDSQILGIFMPLAIGQQRRAIAINEVYRHLT